MARFLALVLVALQLPFFVAADLKGDLNALGISGSYPGDSSYASASKAFNQRFTFRPAAITYPTTAAQVAQIVQAGVAHNIPVVARSGGHSYIANGLGGQDGTLVIDMSKMKQITVNSSQGTATIQTGNRLGNVAQALADAGRALPHGTCPYVGIGGHSAYGGFGFTSRMWGLTLDTITSIDVVLANGTSVTASSTSYPDLFWGLRGSAPSFGITTAITVKTFPAPSSATIFEYTWDMTAANAAAALASFQSFATTNIPKELGAEFTLYKSWRKGYVGLQLVGGWYGAASQLNSTLAPLLNQLPANPSVKQTPGTYLNSVKYLGGGSLDTSGPDETDTFYAKSLMTPASSPMSSQVNTAFTNYMANQGFDTNLNWFVQVELYGGQNSAINAVAPDATAFGSRSSTFGIQFYASSPSYNPPFPSNGFDFVNGLVNSITSNAPSGWNYGAYANYIDDKLADWQTRYYGSNYARLQTLKDTYDPQDTFFFPQAVEDNDPNPPTQPTTVAIHPNGNTAKCIDVRGATIANGTPVQIYDCNGSSAQQWTIKAGSGQVELGKTGYCLDAGSAPANGIKMKIWQCYDNLPAQTWNYTADKRLIVGNNQCLDLTDGKLTNSNQLQTWGCSANNNNQVWTFP